VRAVNEKSDVTVCDFKGVELKANQAVDHGGYQGTVTFVGEDEGRYWVEVLFDFDTVKETERFQASPKDYRAEGPEPTNYVVDELEVLAKPPEPTEQVGDDGIETLAAEQGPRWPSRKAAWLDGWRHGRQHARMTGADLRAAAPAIEARAVDRFVEKLLGELSAKGVGPGDLLHLSEFEQAIDHVKGRG